ncbi:40S ribosomal protein S4 [Myotis brandtii]|uniref:40S ribosomal protein S4 n=1 Tax=Myotis brandtii TaxID=109478 RepID=S7MRS6_MYOBR|nr:40S ribosomal protein S4 [Myotis brandtii]
MAHGPKKHLKCVAAPKHWMLDKLTGDEVKKICMQRFIKIDDKVRTDITYPTGFMDVISIDKTAENFRLIYDTKGHFALHCITPEEAKYKLCKREAPGSLDGVHVKDANGNSFASQLSNIFVKGNKPWISLPHGKGIHLTIAEERDKRLAAKQSSG